MNCFHALQQPSHCFIQNGSIKKSSGYGFPTTKANLIRALDELRIFCFELYPLLQVKATKDGLDEIRILRTQRSGWKIYDNS